MLHARITLRDHRYLASIEALGLEAEGETEESAMDNLIKGFRAWLEKCEEEENLEEVLAQAGFPGAGEDTELELHFV